MHLHDLSSALTLLVSSRDPICTPTCLAKIAIARAMHLGLLEELEDPRETSDAEGADQADVNLGAGGVGAHDEPLHGKACDNIEQHAALEVVHEDLSQQTHHRKTISSIHPATLQNWWQECYLVG